MASEISVDLRLVLDKLRADIRAAAAEIKAGLSVNIGDTAKGTERASRAMEDMERKTKKATSALKDQKQAALDAWRASLPAPQVFGPGHAAPPKPNYSGYGPSMNPTQGPMGPGGGLATGGPQLGPQAYSGPTPPKLPGALANLFSKWASGGLGRGLIGGAAGGLIGGTTGAAIGMAAGGPAGAAMGALILTVQGAKKALHEMANAAERARTMYSKALTSGVGLEFSTRRGILADVIGVGEQDVMKYGNAVNEVNKKVAAASKVFAETTPRLTMLSWEGRALMYDFKALASVIAAELAPEMSRFIRMVRQLAEAFAQVGPMLGQAFKAAIVAAINMALSSIPGAKEAFNMARFLVNKYTPGADEADQPVSAANRFQASAWERMGLVLGNMGSGDYQRQTAQNTKRIAEILSGSGQYSRGGGREPGTIFSPFTNSP